ncbi:MAG: ribonuclease P protein component [Cyanothece sp. SIO1E1]|nr:ribonuclease P protein component [Cyanothece sp. SIO1E1]
MSKISFSFRKEERLKSRKTIDKLFKSGQSFGQFPLRVVWMELETPMGKSPVQFALTVPKKKFKRASDRNRIRRLIREAYRLQKTHFYDHLPEQLEQLAMMVIFTGKEMPDYETVEVAMKQLLRRLAKKCRKPLQ